MGLFDRLGRVVKANLNDMVSKAEDPEKMLEQAILEMQEDLVKLRQGVAQAIAAQKRTEKQYNDSQAEVTKWDRNARLALQKGDENLARQALERKKTYSETATTLETSLQQQVVQVDALKKNLVQLESKISEAKTKKEMLKARITAAKAQEQLQNTVAGMNTNSAMSAFERMEEKVMMIEARAQSGAELASQGLDQQFAALEASGDVDDELALLKAEIEGNQPILPAGAPQANQTSQSTSASTPAPSPADSDLEALKKQLDNL